MRLALLVALLAACEATPARGVTPSAPAKIVAQRTFDAADVLAALKARDGARLDEILDANPALASSHRPDGSSAILVALFLLNADAETFIPPQTNRFLRSLLERHPALDVFDAAAAGDAARVSALVLADPSLAKAVHPKAGCSALHLAAFAGRADVVLFLLSHGAAVNAATTNRFHNTPLVLTALTSQTEVAALLLDHGADVEAAEDGGLRALHIAAETGDPRMLTLLLDHQADPNAKANDGTTPIVIARQKSHRDAERLLISRGARVLPGG